MATHFKWVLGAPQPSHHISLIQSFAHAPRQLSPLSSNFKHPPLFFFSALGSNVSDNIKEITTKKTSSVCSNYPIYPPTYVSNH